MCVSKTYKTKGKTKIRFTQTVHCTKKNIPSLFLMHFMFSELYMSFMVNMPCDAMKSVLSRYILIIEKKSIYNNVKQEKRREEIKLRRTVIQLDSIQLSQIISNRNAIQSPLLISGFLHSPPQTEMQNET